MIVKEYLVMFLILLYILFLPIELYTATNQYRKGGQVVILNIRIPIYNCMHSELSIMSPET